MLRALICAQFLISGLALTALTPLLPRLATHDGLSESAAAVVLSLPGLAMLIVSVPVGLLVDRVGARRVTLAAAALLVAGSGLQATPALAALIAGRLVFGVSYGALWTAGAAWLTALEIGPSHRDEASRRRADGSGIGVAVVCSAVGTMLGPVLAGLLDGRHAQTTVPFGLIAISGVVVAAVLAVWPWERAAGQTGSFEAVPAGDAPHPATSQPSTSHPTVRPSDGRAWVLAGTGSLVVVGAVAGGAQLLIAEGLHADGVGAGGIGLAFSACAAGYIAASAVFVRIGRHAHTLTVNALFAVLTAIALAPALLSGRAGVLVASLLLTAVPRGAISVVAYGVAGRAQTARGGVGSVFGLLNGAWAAASVLAPLAAGALAQLAGPRVAYLAVIGPSVAIAAAIVLGAVRRAAAPAVTPVARATEPA